MTTYRLLLDLDHGKHTTEQTVTAACVHRDDDLVRFHDADHDLVYAVQRGLLLAIERVDDEDQDAVAAEPGQSGPVTIGIKLDGGSIFEAAQSMQALRDDCMRGVGEYMTRLRAAVTQQAADEPEVDLFAVIRARCADQYGWTDEQATEVPDWLVAQLVDHLC